MKQKDLIRMVERDGWYLFRNDGNIRHFKHSLKMGIITIAGRPHDAVAEFTAINILDRAGLR